MKKDGNETRAPTGDVTVTACVARSEGHILKP